MAPVCRLGLHLKINPEVEIVMITKEASLEPQLHGGSPILACFPAMRYLALIALLVLVVQVQSSSWYKVISSYRGLQWRSLILLIHTTW